MMIRIVMDVYDKCPQEWAKEATHGGSDDIVFNIIHLLD